MTINAPKVNAVATDTIGRDAFTYLHSGVQRGETGSGKRVEILAYLEMKRHARFQVATGAEVIVLLETIGRPPTHQQQNHSENSANAENPQAADSRPRHCHGGEFTDPSDPTARWCPRQE